MFKFKRFDVQVIIILEALCKKNGNGMTFEYIAPSTPQQNVVQKLAMFFGWWRSMLDGGNFIDSWGCILWATYCNSA